MRLKKSMADINSKIADIKSNLQMLQQGLVAMNGQKGRSLRTEVEDCLASVTFIQLKFAIWDAFVYDIFEMERRMREWFEKELLRLRDRERDAERKRGFERNRERAAMIEREEERRRDREREREWRELERSKRICQSIESKAKGDRI